MLPASVEKLYTTSTALLLYGPSATLQTSVLGTGSLGEGGVWHGNLYLARWRRPVVRRRRL